MSVFPGPHTDRPGQVCRVSGAHLALGGRPASSFRAVFLERRMNQDPKETPAAACDATQDPKMCTRQDHRPLGRRVGVGDRRRLPRAWGQWQGGDGTASDGQSMEQSHIQVWVV